MLPESSIPIEQVYYRIAQEALENIVKHAHASQVILSLIVENVEKSIVLGNPDYFLGRKEKVVGF